MSHWSIKMATNTKRCVYITENLAKSHFVISSLLQKQVWVPLVVCETTETALKMPNADQRQKTVFLNVCVCGFIVRFNKNALFAPLWSLFPPLKVNNKYIHFSFVSYLLTLTSERITKTWENNLKFFVVKSHFELLDLRYILHYIQIFENHEHPYFYLSSEF